tara:strand:+ start:320 stop:1186 length:867 start_codon:yes stop_codon:yes gene_type:complete
MYHLLKYNFILWILVLFYGCAAQKPAPVDKGYQEKPIEVKKDLPKCPDVYSVKQGETIFSISIKCGVDYKILANANGIKSPYFVKKGDQLRFDIIQNQAKEKVSESESEVVEISTYNEDIIIEQDASSELILGDPIEVKGPKAFKEVYSKKTLKKTKKVISNQNYKKWGWPTDGQPINSFNPSSEKKGVDFLGAPGQQIRSIAKGRVIYAGEELEGYGKMTIIKHDKNILSVYGYQEEILVKEGQSVIEGESIGTMGMTGTDSVKLHFEIRENGKSIDPVKFLSSKLN